MKPREGPRSSADRPPGQPRGGRPHGRKPPLRLMPTTLWEYPSQHHDSPSGASFGDKNYAGATPSWVIWQLLTRYTREDDLVVDPMCGSGTTLDVARDLDRRALGYDVSPRPGRSDIFRADARKLPLEDAKADFVFIDPPYSTHIDYSDDPKCIGKLDAFEAPPAKRRDGGEKTKSGEGDGASLNAYYTAMREVIREIHRVLKPRRYMALYVSDSFRKGAGPDASGFAPIGFDLFALMRERFTPVDIISVVRHNTKLTRGNWRKAAEEGNFFLRGFNYLFIMKKMN